MIIIKFLLLVISVFVCVLLYPLVLISSLLINTIRFFLGEGIKPYASVLYLGKSEKFLCSLLDTLEDEKEKRN